MTLTTPSEVKKDLIKYDYYVGIRKLEDSKFDLTFPIRKFKPTIKAQKLCLDFGDNCVTIFNGEEEAIEINLANYAHRLFIRGLLYFGSKKRNYSPYLIIAFNEDGESISDLRDIIPDSDDKEELEKEQALLTIINPYLENYVGLEVALKQATDAEVLEEFNTLLQGEKIV